MSRESGGSGRTPAGEARRADPGTETRVDAAVAHVHEALQRFFRLAGSGSVGRVEKDMGLGAGTIGTWRRRRQLNLRNLFRILYRLGDPAEFWSLAYPHVPLAERPPGPVRDPVVRALRDPAGTHEDEIRRTRKLSEDELRRIDACCLDEPRVALRKSKAALRRAGREQWPRLLGLYGSAQLALGRLREALDALHFARELAEGGEDRTVRADVLRRLGDAYAAAECPVMAMLFVKEAWHGYRLAQDASGEARCLHVLADRLDGLGQHEEADLARAAASRLAPADAKDGGAAGTPRPPSSSTARVEVRVQPGSDTACHGHGDLLGQAGNGAGGVAGAAEGGLPHGSNLAAGAARTPRPPSSSAARVVVWMQPGTDTACHGHGDLLGQAGSDAGGVAGAAEGGLPHGSNLAERRQEDWVDESLLRVHRVLRTFFALDGWGSVKRAERALGIADGAIRKWRLRRLMKLPMLLRLLHRLGDPAHFWCEAYPGAVFDQPAPWRTRDRTVRRVLQLEDRERRAASPPGGVEATRWERWRPAGSSELRRLDELRHTNPRAAAREARAALRLADRDSRPQLLAVYGSALRAQGHHDRAVEVLRHALELACRRKDRGLIAEVCQRLGVAHAYSGDQALGLLYAKEATYQFRLAGDAAGEGRSLVDQGNRLSHLGQQEASITTHEIALPVLPAREVRHRFAAHSTLAITLQQRDLRRALRHAVQGSRLAPELGEVAVAVNLTTMAEILHGLGDAAEAERCYREAVEIHAARSPIDAALASVDLARIQLARGRTAAAGDTLLAMGRFVEKLDNPLVRGAMVQLMRMSLSGRVTTGILEQAAQVVRRHRAGADAAPVSGRAPSARSSAPPR